MKLRPPKILKLNPRKTRKHEREVMRDVAVARRYVERAGGEEAVQRQMEETARQFGGSYGLPRFAAKTPVDRKEYFETEVKMRGMVPVGKAYQTRDGVFLMPGGLAKAIVPIPKPFRKAFRIAPHSTSTFARAGINLGDSQSTFQRQLSRRVLPATMEVFIHNMASIPVRMRNGDPCRLLNIDEIRSKRGDPKLIKTSPRTTATETSLVNLHVGDEVVEVNHDALPLVKIGDQHIRYIDPRARNFASQFTTRAFNKLLIKAGQFFVISTREHMAIPINHVGWVQSSRDNLMHSTAKLAHGGWEGKMALEFLALRDHTLKPGDKVAWLTVHPTANSKGVYTGRYQRQESAAPKSEK
ncbi:MAG: hypothetical protein V1722_00975 [Candidatus Micrarchaeota archaeon]